MKPFLDTLRRLAALCWEWIEDTYDRLSVWLAVPVNLCLAILGLVFLVSFGSWAIVDRFAEVVVWFPDAKGALHGELRQVPVKWRVENRAEGVASELLLGPKTLELKPAFLPGVRVESVLYRRGRLFLDISRDAAIMDTQALKVGLAAMDRSLRAALPGVRRLTVTIGGIEPYVSGLKNDVRGGSKKAGK